MQVAITGATGTIGRRLTAALLARGDEVVPFSRRDTSVEGLVAVRWDPATQAVPRAALAGVDAVVNLAGAPVEGRWSAARKREIRDSRVETTRRLAEAIAAGAGPRVLVSASAVGYYGARGDEEVDETSPPGDGFLAEVCRDWEAAAMEAAASGARVAMARIGIVLAREGGALPKLAGVTRRFAGGPLGGGRQWMPWIAADDVVGLLLAALDGDAYSGPFNATAPHPVRQRDFAAALGAVLGRPSLVPTPAIALKVIMGETAEIALAGQRAVPRVALANGYRFRFEDLTAALRAELGQRPAAAGSATA